MSQENEKKLIVYGDRISEVYEDFIYEFETKGLQWAWMVRKEFFQIPEDKKILPFFISLPLLTYTRIQMAKSKNEIEQELAELKKKYETLPEFQGREMPQVPTIRDVMDQYFMVYPDDEIEFKISYYHHTLVQQQGLIKDLKFNIDDVVKNKKVRVSTGDLLTVTIKLINKGNQRFEEEYKAFLNEPETFVDEKINIVANQEKIKSLPIEVLEERKILFGYDKNTKIEEVEWDIKKLPAQDVVVLEEMVNALLKPHLTNEQILAQSQCLRMVNLDKMVDWLNRSYGGGTEEDYR
jgi:hypothetical protein